MISIMEKFDTNNLVKVIMDGLYYRGEMPDADIKLPYKNKDVIQHKRFRDYWYYPSEVDISEFAKFDERYDGNVVLAGAGGTGKTYTTFNYNGLMKPLYVVPSHVLGKAFNNAYNSEYTTINKLIGHECTAYKESYKIPHTIFVDELTMINKSWIEKALEMYPTSMFILAGDIKQNGQWFQCRNGVDGKTNDIYIPLDWRYVYFNNDMRSKDDEIRNLKINIREQMSKLYNDLTAIGDLSLERICGNVGADILNRYIKLNYKVIPFADAVTMHKSGNIWIAGTHKTNERLLKAGVVSGYINKNHEINDCEGEKRGSFTIHSYQGLTIEDKKVFICLDNFEYAMLYTAVSRCRSINQIIFVSP